MSNLAIFPINPAYTEDTLQTWNILSMLSFPLWPSLDQEKLTAPNIFQIVLIAHIFSGLHPVLRKMLKELEISFNKQLTGAE